MEKVYIQAVVELLAAGSDIETLLANLRSVMVARGHVKAFPAVLKGIVRVLQETADITVPVVRVARASDEVALEKEIKQALVALGADTKAVSKIVDDTIIGGLIATYNHRQIDQSYRSKLVTLYQSITN